MRRVYCKEGRCVTMHAGEMMIHRLGLVLITLAGCAAATPLSVDVRYSADAARVANAEQLASARIAVGRFSDSRPRRSADMHAASYVGHDGSYDVGLTWQGRTFASVPEVVQALLIEELEHAGLSVEPVDTVIKPGDVEAARVAAEKGHCDLALGGDIAELIYRTPDSRNGSVKMEVQLFEGVVGKALARFPASGSQNAEGEERPQQRVDALLERSFKQAAHRVVERVASEVAVLLAAANKE